jgi:hypothetical protein
MFYKFFIVTAEMGLWYSHCGLYHVAQILFTLIDDITLWYTLVLS